MRSRITSLSCAKRSQGSPKPRRRQAQLEMNACIANTDSFDASDTHSCHYLHATLSHQLIAHRVDGFSSSCHMPGSVKAALASIELCALHFINALRSATHRPGQTEYDRTSAGIGLKCFMKPRRTCARFKSRCRRQQAYAQTLPPPRLCVSA